MSSHCVRFLAAARASSRHRPTCHRALPAIVLSFGLTVAACSSVGTRGPAADQAPPVAGADMADTHDASQLLIGAEVAQHEGRFPDAARLYLRAARASADEQLAETATRACYDNLQLDAALQLALRWLQINPTSQPAREVAALSALKLYRIDAAAEQLQVLLHSAYITPAAGFIELLPKLESTDSNAATAVVKQLVEDNAGIAEAQYVLALLAAQTANGALMLSAAARAHELAPYWSPAGLLLARAQLLNGQPELALQTGQEVVRGDDSVATRADYAGLLMAAKRGEDAVKLWRELEEQGGDNSAAVRALAQLDFQLGNYQSAFTRFNRLLNTGKNLSESIFYLGNIAERTGATAEARQLYDRVQEGEFAAAAQLRIAGLIRNGEGVTAAQTFLQSYGEANPEELLLTLKARADMLSDSGDDAAALAIYDQAVKQYPDVAELRLSRAFQLIRMHKLQPAIQAMQQLVAERPQDPTVLNALGYTLVDNTRQYQAGHDYIVRALSYAPDNGALLDSMGWALFKLGRPTEALPYLERAVQRISDPELDLHLGEVLWSLKRRDDALKVWEAGLQRAPDNKLLQQRIKRAKRA